MSGVAQKQLCWEIIVSDLNGWEVGRLTCGPGKYVFGRACKCDVRIRDDNTFARQHCELMIPAGTTEQPILFDLGSRNGTFVDEKLVVLGGSHPLRDGSIIIVGRTKITFSLL
jgi:predicted component of type VI protein secretion system